ncbi:hypothetical protein B0T19DRAFT_273157 [Cercophora scortea]|uniref:Uncharacterized protein n=1 Tax=Cercophora scortea TaxID=314031 RepID=A0AAE0I767_9PEZI|nr:hypothetical protein B0T19DRAFT_273157 [Cercophora scortea]
MSTVNVDQVLYSRAGWRLRFLVPCWTFQVAVVLCLMGIFAYRLVETFEHYDESKKNGQIPMVEVVYVLFAFPGQAFTSSFKKKNLHEKWVKRFANMDMNYVCARSWESTNVGFSVISLMLSIIEISRAATESLTPFTMLCTHVIKLTLAFAILGLDVTVYLKSLDGQYSIVALALDCGLLAVTIATFIYSIKTFRRLLKYEDYAMTTDTNLEMGHGKRSSVLHHHQSTEYPSTTAGLKAEVDKRIGAEFGWSSTGRAVEPDGSVVVGGGVVHAGKVQAGAVPRKQSWATETGTYDPMDGDDDDDDDDSDTVRGRDSREVVRHASVPALLVDGHEDTQALIPGHGPPPPRAG